MIRWGTWNKALAAFSQRVSREKLCGNLLLTFHLLPRLIVPSMCQSSSAMSATRRWDFDIAYFGVIGSGVASAEQAPEQSSAANFTWTTSPRSPKESKTVEEKTCARSAVPAIWEKEINRW